MTDTFPMKAPKRRGKARFNIFLPEKVFPYQKRYCVCRRWFHNIIHSWNKRQFKLHLRAGKYVNKARVIIFSRPNHIFPLFALLRVRTFEKTTNSFRQTNVI